MPPLTGADLLGATAGWVSIGIADSPKMSPSDDIVGWVSDADGSVSVLDCWSPDYNQVSTVCAAIQRY